ncbi:MAG: MotA/TolQ/ExbB proton channel family protein [Pirellulaceae bacterium]|nr:MotA/TolQ/ExbB proton channel family protein [Pirellulaceae bacterium]
MKFRESRWLQCLVTGSIAWLVVGFLWSFPFLPPALGQEGAGPAGAFADDESDAPVIAEDAVEPAVEKRRREGVNLLSLMLRGGFLMLPILLLSVLVVIIAIERFIGLRRQKILPVELVEELGRLGGPAGAFDPRNAYQICQQYPSAAANVIRAMLLKVGRPHSEVESAAAEAREREAQQVFANVKWLTLAAAVAPLLGLLGTVWGMIEAFYETTQLDPGQNKADELARGIYVALVTTFSGLVVAIPAAILSHFFEGRVQSLFYQIEELLFSLMPQVERYEGRVRFGSGSQADDRAEAPPPPHEEAVLTSESTEM